MCKSKKNAEVMRSSKPSRSRTKGDQQSTLSSSSSASSLYPSSVSNNFVPITGSTSSFNNFKDNSHSWQSSLSSRTSLSSLRESLSDQPHIFDFSEICAATNNFHLKPLSSSSSSTSWRCLIRSQDVVVIQRKFRRPIDTPQLIERISIICRSHHSSVVKLKGASISGNYIYLVYEYVPGVNLAEALRNRKNPNFTILSNWMSRIKVADDLAHGLNYIHNSTGLGFSFVHNHIKSSSIIVTEPSLNAKICHFGTAELCGELAEEEAKSKDANESKRPELKRSDSKAQKLEGTRGYMAPEFQSTAMATQKSDVYAFGVLILQLLWGNEAVRYRFDEITGGYVRESVIEAARAAVEGEEGVRWWVDRRLKDSYPVEVAEMLARVGLECVDDDPIKRPDMGKVVDRISGLFVESEKWAQNMGGPIDLTITFGPR